MTLSNAHEKAVIGATISGYFKALNDGNVDAVLELYTDDPVMLPFLQATVIGIEAVRQNYVNTFQLMRFQVETKIEEIVEMSPEWAYVRTETAGTFTPIRTGQDAPSNFHELFLLRKASDGRWQIARYSFSPTSNLPDV